MWQMTKGAARGHDKRNKPFIGIELLRALSRDHGSCHSNLLGLFIALGDGFEK